MFKVLFPVTQQVKKCAAFEEPEIEGLLQLLQGTYLRPD